MTAFRQDPGERIQRTFDWSDWLVTAETITAHTLTADAGLDVTTIGSDDTTVTYRAGSDTAGSYTLACRVTTSSGEIGIDKVTFRVR